MRFTFDIPILLALSLAALPSLAFEDASRQPLQLRSKSAIATAVATATPNVSAPYARPMAEPEPEPLLGKRDLRENQSRSSCESGRALCYDQQSGRIVYKAARNYMPDLPGLQAENISVKRDRIVFKYSF
jgi:hypothetical protein